MYFPTVFLNKTSSDCTQTLNWPENLNAANSCSGLFPKALEGGLALLTIVLI
jgi:hypothetical protein